jgi:hypothetical protein
VRIEGFIEEEERNVSRKREYFRKGAGFGASVNRSSSSDTDTDPSCLWA